MAPFSAAFVAHRDQRSLCKTLPKAAEQLTTACTLQAPCMPKPCTFRSPDQDKLGRLSLSYPTESSPTPLVPRYLDLVQLRDDRSRNHPNTLLFSCGVGGGGSQTWLTSSAQAFAARTSTAGGRPSSPGAPARYISAPGCPRSYPQRHPKWPSPKCTDTLKSSRQKRSCNDGHKTACKKQKKSRLQPVGVVRIQR